MSSHADTHSLVLSCAQVRLCDSIAIERFGISGLVLMENAGLAAADIIRFRLKDITGQAGNSANPKVCILAGTGNNGGDGFVVARHLYNHAVPLEVFICGPRSRIKGDARVNLRIIDRMGLTIIDLPEFESDHPAPAPTPTLSEWITAHLSPAGLVVDAMLGTGAVGTPRQPIRSVIDVLNTLAKPVIALDIPSGLNGDTGRPSTATIRAEHTVTFAALKLGFLQPGASDWTGTVTVASIGIDTALLVHSGKFHPHDSDQSTLSP